MCVVCLLFCMFVCACLKICVLQHATAEREKEVIVISK